ncbi:magnesium transporter CorA family protein [Candidatus Gracilibacteria bacterium]|nr:magnesium transporter CorA family protein [Candidatus Gracilibacteria bacterium]
MEKSLSIGGITWVHFTNPSSHELKEIVETYDVHDIIKQDIKENNTQDKIDVYDDSIFLVLHFPKYDKKTGKYYSNEFNIILGKDFIVSVATHHTNHIDNIRKQYSEDIKNKDPDEEFKVSPYYILYKIIDVMYDKVIGALNKFNQDLNKIEESVFNSKVSNRNILENMLIKKRNIVYLKHLIIPQSEILQELQKATAHFYQGDLDVYFEDIIYKTDKILANINMAMENTESVSTIYNTLANIKTNSVVSMLTIWTVIIGIMTMITGLYGMNVQLPFQEKLETFRFILAIMIAISGIMFLIFKRKKRI